MGRQELMKWKQQTSDACDEAPFEKANSPFAGQFLSQYPNQDYCSVTDSKQGRYSMEERQDTQYHGFFS
jgi:hypothetical protein